MPPGRLSLRPLPPRWTWVLVGLVHLAALGLWGNPELVHDEADYIAQGQILKAWLQGAAGVGVSEVFGRFALHNPGYALGVAVLEALSGHGALLVRILQCLVGVLTGFVLYAALHPRVGARTALAATLIFWLHPSMIFFRLSLWPVVFATLGTTLLAYGALQLAEKGESGESTQLRSCFGWTLALLPFFAPPALLLLPAVAVAFGPERWRALCGPALALWLPWMLALSLTLGAFVPVDLSSSRNLVLANHPAISEGRGALWGDRAAKQTYLAELALACPQETPLQRKRCEHRFNTQIARQTVAANPGAAVQRSFRRIAETWTADRFLPRSLDSQGRAGAAGTASLLAVLHWALLGLALLGLRSPRGRAALGAALLWTLPVLVAVGFTRLRQPVLPFLLIAAAFGIHSLTSRQRLP